MNISGLDISWLVLLLCLANTIAILYFYRLKRRIFTMANNWASHMGKASGKVRHDAAQTRQLESGQAKVIETLSAQIPGLTGILKSSGVSDGEAWALATDPNTLKGLKVIFDTLGGAAKFFNRGGDGGPKKKRPRKNVGDAPLKELRHSD